jgi:hypothetical protein
MSFPTGIPPCQGQYQLKLSYWSPAGTGAAQAAQRHCAALLGTVALLAAKGRDTSNYRQESALLDDFQGNSKHQMDINRWLIMVNTG